LIFAVASPIFRPTVRNSQRSFLTYRFTRMSWERTLESSENVTTGAGGSRVARNSGPLDLPTIVSQYFFVGRPVSPKTSPREPVARARPETGVLQWPGIPGHWIFPQSFPSTSLWDARLTKPLPLHNMTGCVFQSPPKRGS
jgi:hypothetical protein